MLISAACAVLGELGEAEAEQGLHNKYIEELDFASKESLTKLTLNHYDKKFFKARVVDRSEVEPEVASHKLIASGFLIFIDRFRRLAKDPPSGSTASESVIDVVNTLVHKTSVIDVRSTDEDSAADIFETLNDRGIGLSTPDLLRNLVLRRAKSDSQRSTIIDKWEAIVEFDNDTTIKRFLRHYWISHFGDVKSQGLYREIKATIVADDLQSVDLADEMSQSAVNYKQLIEASTKRSDLNSELEAVRALNASLVMPAVLASFEALKAADALAAVRATLRLFIRHSTICGRENSRLENVVYSAARSLRHHKNLSKFVAELSNANPSDRDVKASFAELEIPNSRGKARRYLLVQLADQIAGTGEVQVADPAKVHVEHIYPQNPKKRLVEHNSLVHRIGNMTLLASTLNESLKNADFAKKKVEFGKSQIKMTSDLAAHPDSSWGRAQIKGRQAELAKLACKIWPEDLIAS